MKNFKFSAWLLGACAVLSACMGSQPLTAPGGDPAVKASIPPALQVSANEKVSFTWQAIGAQIYECKANAAGGWAWAFVGPEARLFNAKEEQVGAHGAGPFWQAMDGSKITGMVKARADGAHSTDIPWLLLAVTSVGGPGKMSPVTSVQRIHTEGGTAPLSGCSSAAEAGKVIREGYTADYVFYVSR